MPKPQPLPPQAGQESVWDYPRPPRLERVLKRITVVFSGITIGDSVQAYRVLETSHPPVYYLPPKDIQIAHLRSATGQSWCEWKGRAVYFDVVVGDRVAQKAAWSYPQPAQPFAPIANHIAFYAWAMDECRVDGEIATPQPGRFYGGWITSDITGPFKGEPGSSGW